MEDKDGILAIDSGFHANTARQILRRIRKSSLRKILVLNTHYHSDHVFGNNVLSDAGATIFAHWKCLQRMRVLSPRLLSGFRKRDPSLTRLLKEVEISYPMITFSENLSLHLGEETMVEL